MTSEVTRLREQIAERYRAFLLHNAENRTEMLALYQQLVTLVGAPEAARVTSEIMAAVEREVSDSGRGG